MSYICPNCRGSLTDSKLPSCKTCGWHANVVDGILEFLTEKQRNDSSEQDYQKNYEEIATDDLLESIVDKGFLKRQAINFSDYLGKIGNLKICEVGVGQGFLFEEIIKKDVASYFCVDIATSYLKKLKKHTNAFPCIANAEALPFENHFDLIVATDVLEHVLNAGSFLFCMNKALVLGGKVAIRVPLEEGILNYSPHRGFKHSYGHLRSFDKKILKIYLKQAGFKVQKFHLDGVSPWMPRPWVANTKFGFICQKFLFKYIENNLQHWSDVITLPKILVFAMMKPMEIVVVAEKIKDLSYQGVQN